jgi:hypothetical protein
MKDPAEAVPKPIPSVARKRQLSNEVCCGVIRDRAEQAASPTIPVMPPKWSAITPMLPNKPRGPRRVKQSIPRFRLR